ARRSSESNVVAESRESALVLPRPAGDARVLRPLARRRRAAGTDHRRTDGHSVHRYESERQRLLLVSRAEMGDRNLPVRLPGAVVVPDHHRNVPARTELELLRTLRILGSEQTRSAGQRRFIGARVGELARDAAAEALADSGDVRHPSGHRLSQSAAAARGESVPPLLFENGSGAILRRLISFPGDDGAADQDGAPLAV